MKHHWNRSKEEGGREEEVDESSHDYVRKTLDGPLSSRMKTELQDSYIRESRVKLNSTWKKI